MKNVGSLSEPDAVEASQEEQWPCKGPFSQAERMEERIHN
jgi:hypothetical protein